MDTKKYRNAVEALREQTEDDALKATMGKHVSRRTILQTGVGVAVVTVGIGTFLGVERGISLADKPSKTVANPVVPWNSATLQAIGDTATGPTIGARALAIVHTSMYDAWTTYDKNAVPTQNNGIPKQKDKKGVDASQAVSFAAYHALVDLFPSRGSCFQRRDE